MAKKAAAMPLTADDGREILRVVIASHFPMSELQIRKQGVFSRTVKAAELQGLLDLAVSEGQLTLFPAKTKTGKPSYWDRDPQEIVYGALVELVVRSTEPISESKIKSLLKLPFKVGDAERERALQRAVGEGRVFTIPSKTAKGRPTYFGRSPWEYGRACLLAELGKKGALTEAALRKAVAWLPAAEQTQAIEDLQRSGRLFAHPPLGTGKSRSAIWGLSPPAPAAYLEPIRKQLAALTEQLRGSGVSDVEMRRAVAVMLEGVGISFGGSGGAASGNPPATEGTQVDLVRLMKQVDSQATRGALVTARALRRAAGLDKAEFDRLALQSAREGKVDLHEHDFPYSLSAEDRDVLIADGHGRFFVGLGIRG